MAGPEKREGGRKRKAQNKLVEQDMRKRFDEMIGGRDGTKRSEETTVGKYSWTR